MSGWIENTSGQCPVEKGTLIDVKYRDGEVLLNSSALMNTHGFERDTAGYFWQLGSMLSDITFWRPSKALAGLEAAENSNTSAFEDLAATLVKQIAPNVSLGTNPKAVIGASKLPLHLWSPLASAYGAVALSNGAGKYGIANYKATPVLASVYLSALMRHYNSWLEGEEFDPVDGQPHLGGILANVAILLDSRAAGMLVDDRPIPGGYLKELEAVTKVHQSIQAMNKDKAPHHYTRDNA
jgi:hypothetical protein